MNWSLIILGLVALSSVAIAENSYLIAVPKLFKVGHDNQLSVFIGAASQPVEVKYWLSVGSKRLEGKITITAGQTRNATLALPWEFPIGAGELTITGTGGIQFEEKRDAIVYDSRHVILVQTSASMYRPGDMMEMRVIATNEELMPLEKGECLIEIYDATLKLVGRFPMIPIQSGITENVRFPVSLTSNVGSWLVSATIGNTTSSLEVLVAAPITPSFDLKAIFQRFLLRTDKTLRGVVEIDSDTNEPIFGRATIAVGQITEQDVQEMMKNKQKSPQQKIVSEEWRKWKSQQMDVAGRIEINYDLLSVFNVDVTKVLAIQVYIQVVELGSGQERFIQHVIPIFTRDVVYDIRPLEFETGIKNEFEIIAKRPDGKPTKMEDMIVTVTMMLGNDQGKMQEEKSVEIKEFYTRGRNDIGFFNIEIPQNCIGVLMTITPLGDDGKVRGYRTHAVPLMPRPHRDSTRGAKLTIELLPSPTEANSPVVSSQISTVGRTSNFYVQLLPSKSIEKFEPLPMSYVLMTNGRITLTGEFTIQPTKHCQSRASRSIQPEGQQPPVCLYNGTLPIQITRSMIPYSTLLVYTFQPSFGFYVAESYRFSVAGLFKGSFALNATIVPYTSTMTQPEEMEMIDDEDLYEEMNGKRIELSMKAQDKSRVQLSFTGTPDATVGLNVIEYDGVIQGLSNEITKERLLQYLTTYEQVPIMGMSTMMEGQGEQKTFGIREAEDDEEHTHGEREAEDDEEHTHGEREAEDDEEQTHGERASMDEKMTKDKTMETTTVLPTRSTKRMTTKSSHTTSFKTSSKFETTTASGSFKPRGVISEELEQKNMNRDRMGLKARYPIEKMIFGIESTRSLRPVEGDDVYTSSSMERFYGDARTQKSSASSHYRRKSSQGLNQYDVSFNDNNYVVATSMPLILTAEARARAWEQSKEKKPMMHDEDFEQTDEIDASRVHGSPAWYEKMNSKLTKISQEAFTFMQSGLSIVSDFSALRVPSSMQRANLTKIFSKYRQQSWTTIDGTFTERDDARQVLEQYMWESDMSMIPPPIVFEERARLGYYRSVFFNTSRIESQGTGKVVLPRTKPYSTWLATGFSLHPKSGLSVAQPIRLPTNQGLYVLANFPQKVQIGEQVLLAYGINNYLGKDLSNVVIRIRASADFDLMEPSQPERIVSTNGKDYTVTLPSLKALAVVTRNLTVVPKRAGVVKILIEVESEFGGDYEYLTTYVRESGIKRKQVFARLYDLTEEKKSMGPIVQKMTVSPFLRSVRFMVSGTGLDHLVDRNAMETSNLIGLDRAIIRLWRGVGLRRYLNETSQAGSFLDQVSTTNISVAYQKLQLYSGYDGSYSFISDEGLEQSSFYLTALSFGAMVSPFMPVRDYVTLNRTLSWVLSRQQQDGSFDDQGPCYHYRFCTGEYRREALTALFYYSMTRFYVPSHLPEFLYQRLYNGEQSPMMRAHRWLESRWEAVKPCMLTTSLVELALGQSKWSSEQLRQKIKQSLLSRPLIDAEEGSKYWKYNTERMSYDDQFLANSMTLSLYTVFGEYKTSQQIARWLVQQFQKYPYHDTVLDAVFSTEAWLQTGALFRKQYGLEKFSVTVDVSADNGEKQQIKLDPTNMDMSYTWEFKLPVNQITYTLSGFGFAGIRIYQTYIEKQQQTSEPTPFELTNEFSPLPWLNEIKTKTCLTYTPTAREQKIKATFNRTVVVEFQLPSGTRVNLRQIGFLLSRIPNVMYFTFHERKATLNFFLNIPSTIFGKPMCFDWILERLSWVSSWAPIRVRAYDYLQQETQMQRLFPVQFQPNTLGYSFVEAVHKARPSLDEIAKQIAKSQ